MIFFDDFEYHMDPRDVQDLYKAILKHRRFEASGNRDSGIPSSVPKVGNSGNNYSAFDALEGPLFAKERARSFL